MSDGLQVTKGVWGVPDCRVYWGSHGCHLERGHDGDCQCDCCDCGEHHPYPDWPDESVLCVATAPYYGVNTRFYGEDVAARGLPDHDVPLEPRDCDHCNMKVIEEGDEPDPCWGKLPGVWSACCGHGESDGYIAFDNGVTIRFSQLRVDPRGE